MNFRSFLGSVKPISVCFIVLFGCETARDGNTAPGGALNGRLEVSRQFVNTADYKKAIGFLIPMSKDFPDNTQVMMLLGLSYLGNGNIDASVDQFKRIVDLEKNNFDAKLNLGYGYIIKHRYADARKVLNEIVKDGSYMYMERVHSNIGLSYLEERKYDAALLSFEESIRLDPTFVQAHFNAGKCWIVKKNYVAAESSFSKALDFCPGCIEPTIEMARVLALSGKKMKAVQNLEKMLSGKIDASNEAKARRLLNEIKR